MAPEKSSLRLSSSAVRSCTGSAEAEPPLTLEERRAAWRRGCGPPEEGLDSQVDLTSETADVGYAFHRGSHSQGLGPTGGRDPLTAQGDLRATAVIPRTPTLTLCPSLPTLHRAHGPHKHILTCGIFAWNFLHLL